MKHWLHQFRKRESGAITIDWVVLTAALVGLALGVIITVRDPAISVATSLGESLELAASTEYDL